MKQHKKKTVKKTVALVPPLVAKKGSMQGKRVIKVTHDSSGIHVKAEDLSENITEECTEDGDYIRKKVVDSWEY